MASGAVQQSHGVGFPLIHIHVPYHRFVAGQFDIPAKQIVGDPDQGVKPVDSQNSVAQQLPPVVFPGKVGPFMGQDKTAVFRGESCGQVDPGGEKAQNEGRIQFPTFPAACFQLHGAVDLTLQSEVADCAAGTQPKNAKKPCPGSKSPKVRKCRCSRVLYRIDVDVIIPVLRDFTGQGWERFGYRVIIPRFPGDRINRHIGVLLRDFLPEFPVVLRLQAQRAFDFKGQHQPQSHQQPKQADHASGCLFQQQPQGQNCQDHHAAVDTGFQNGKKQGFHGYPSS